MRVLLLQETDWLRRGPHQQHHLMDRLSLRSHEVRVIDFEILWRKDEKREFYTKRRIFTNISKACKNADVVVIRPSIIKIPMLDYVSILFSHGKEIYRQIKDFRPEVVIGFSILNAYLGMRIAKRNNIPFVYYLNDAVHTLVPFRRLQPIAKIIESETLKHAERVIVINEELRKYAINLGAKPKRVTVIRAGIDSSKFNPSVDGSRVRERYGISKDDVVLFFMGWLYTFSGLREVAHSLLEAKDKHPNIKLLIVGRGDAFDELHELMKKLGSNRLILVNWQPYEKIPEYIAAADLCLLPAHHSEVMMNIVPIKMYEYMASGKPVIATKLPGVVKEFGYDNGVIYVNQPSEILKKVIKLCRNSSSLTEYGAKAQRFIARYSWDKITDEFEDVLKNVAFSS